MGDEHFYVAPWILIMFPGLKDKDKDFSSEEELDISQTKSASIFPKFIVVQAVDKDKPITKKSPFAIEKQIKSISGTVQSIKNLRNGTLLIEVKTKQQAENLLKTSKFLDQKVKTFAHQSLNFSKGVIRCREIADMPMEELKKEMLEEGVTDVKRITIKRNNQEILTNTYIFTFNSPKLPEKVKVSYLYRTVEVYVPNPLRCFRCQVFGHHESGCKAQAAVCGRCAGTGHDFKDCTAEKPKCANCQQEHIAGSRNCSFWKKEKEILRIKYSDGVSFFQARTIYEQRNKIQEQNQSNRSYANITKEKSPETELCKILVDQICQLLPEKAKQIRQLVQSLIDGPVSATQSQPTPVTTKASETLPKKPKQSENKKTPEQKTPTKQSKMSNEPKKKIQLNGQKSISKHSSADNTMSKDKKGKIRRCVVGESNEIAPNPIPADANPFEPLEDMEEEGDVFEHPQSTPDSWMDRPEADD